MKNLFSLYSSLFGEHANEEKVVEVPQKKELTKKGSIKRRKGQFLFMLHNNNVTKVDTLPQEIQITNTGTTKKRTRVDLIPGAVYIQALNKKNAVRKLTNIGYQIA